MREVQGERPGPVPVTAPILSTAYPRVGTPLDITILSLHPVGVPTHWARPEGQDKAHSVWCAGLAECRYCKAGVERCWNGHLAAYSWGTLKLRCIVLGSKSWAALDAAIPPEVPLLGQRVVLTRAGEYKTATLRVERSDHRTRCPVTGPIDLTPTLRALYGDKAFPVPEADRGDAWEEPK